MVTVLIAHKFYMQNSILSSNHSIWKWPVVSSVCLVLMLLHVMPAWAAKTTGYVGSFNCSPQYFKLTRYRAPIRVERNKPLYTGDKITVLKGGCSIQLVLLGKTNITLFGKNDFHRVKKMAPPSNKTTKSVRGAFSRWWSGLWEHSDHENAIAATAGKYGDLTIPLLRKGNVNKLRAGKDVVYLAWQGRNPPYTVKLQQTFQTLPDKSRPIKFKENNVKDTQIALTKQALRKQGVELKKGAAFWVKISDARNENVFGQFTVVADFPHSFTPSWTEKPEILESKEMCAIHWLDKVKSKPRQWNFEAYQIVAGGGDKKILSACGL